MDCDFAGDCGKDTCERCTREALHDAMRSLAYTHVDDLKAMDAAMIEGDRALRAYLMVVAPAHVDAPPPVPFEEMH